jgi:hypothetical protein
MISATASASYQIAGFQIIDPIPDFNHHACGGVTAPLKTGNRIKAPLNACQSWRQPFLS